MASVADQIKRIAVKSNQKVETVIKKSLIRLSTQIIQRSPVDTGRFKNNWLGAYGAIDTTVTTNKAKTSFGDAYGAVVDRATMKINGMEAGEVFYFTNSLPYAQRLEYLGWSAQAPQGMVRVSVASWISITDEEIRKAR